MHFVKYKLFSSANVRLPVPAVIAQPSPNLYECWYVCVWCMLGIRSTFLHGGNKYFGGETDEKSI